MISDFHPIKPPKPEKLDTKIRLPKQEEPAPTKEPTFRPPEEIEAEEEKLVRTMDLPPGAPKPNRKPRNNFFKNFFVWPPNKQGYIGAAILLVLFGSGAGAWILLKPHHVSKPVAKGVVKPVKKAAPKPTTVPSTLSGLPVDPSVNQRPVTAVMVENSLDARPQSGLAQASVVFEAIAEGGVTRFMAVYQDTQPDNIGPIRSARPYYVAWALGFDAGYAHVGGSPDGLQDIKDWGVRDLDQFYNSGSYHRITTRQAPHNVYTSLSILNQLELSKGYTSSNFTGFARKKEAKPAQATTTSIDLTMSGPLYNAHYDYDAGGNAYKRSEAGEPHTDADTGAQIEPKVVIAMVVPLSQGALDSSGAFYSNYNVLGSGTAYVFQDGAVTTVTWNKAANNSSLSFTDSTGKPFALNPGQTWITAVSDSSKVSYQ